LTKACWRGHVVRQQYGLLARVLARSLRKRAEIVAHR
jgi:hypothetical protein